MDVSVKRKEILKWVASAGEDTLEILDQIRSYQTSDWWSELTDSEKAMIAEGQKDIDEGKIIPHDQVTGKYDL